MTKEKKNKLINISAGIILILAILLPIMIPVMVKNYKINKLVDEGIEDFKTNEVAYIESRLQEYGIDDLELQDINIDYDKNKYDSTRKSLDCDVSFTLHSDNIDKYYTDIHGVVAEHLNTRLQELAKNFPILEQYGYTSDGNTLYIKTSVKYNDFTSYSSAGHSYHFFGNLHGMKIEVDDKVVYKSDSEYDLAFLKNEDDDNDYSSSSSTYSYDYSSDSYSSSSHSCGVCDGPASYEDPFNPGTWYCRKHYKNAIKYYYKVYFED